MIILKGLKIQSLQFDGIIPNFQIINHKCVTFLKFKLKHKHWEKFRCRNKYNLKIIKIT
jgi:hypothetical protein